MAKVYEDPGPLPEGATPAERREWSRKNELFCTEGFKKLPPRDQVPKIDHTDQRLKQLRRDHQQFLAMRSPFKAALWLALSLPAKDVIHKAEMTRRFILAQKGELEAGQAFVAPEDLTIVELTNLLAARGLGGDLTAIEQIATRIEGKAGARVDDVDSEDTAAKQKLHTVTENLVALLTNAAMKEVPKRGDDAKVFDVEVVDKEPKGE
jgi:hypothetical protein